jgi:hypothetical protein
MRYETTAYNTKVIQHKPIIRNLNTLLITTFFVSGPIERIVGESAGCGARIVFSINRVFEMKRVFLIDFIVEELDCSWNCLRGFEDAETHDGDRDLKDGVGLMDR